jgi:alpha/beta superfamily hydrolase
MRNNVVAGIFDGLSERGRAVLRFNFRGVGRSGGRSGSGEAEDLEAAVDFLATATGGVPHDVAVAGYSYGAMVACAAVASGPSFSALVAIAPPLAMADFSALETCGIPVYAICGAQDEYCDAGEAEALIDRCASPKGLAIIPGTDHFFGREEAALAAQVELFLGEVARTL